MGGAKIKGLWEAAQENTVEGKSARRALSEILLQQTEMRLKKSLFDNKIRDLDPNDLDKLNSYKLAIGTAIQYLSGGLWSPDLSEVTRYEEANQILLDAIEQYREHDELPHKDPRKRSTSATTHRVRTGSLDDKLDEAT